jgi:hypothetical protein
MLKNVISGISFLSHAMFATKNYAYFIEHTLHMLAMVLILRISQV